MRPNGAETRMRVAGTLYSGLNWERILERLKRGEGVISWEIIGSYWKAWRLSVVNTYTCWNGFKFDGMNWCRVPYVDNFIWPWIKNVLYADAVFIDRGDLALWFFQYAFCRYKNLTKIIMCLECWTFLLLLCEHVHTHSLTQCDAPARSLRTCYHAFYVQ